MIPDHTRHMGTLTVSLYLPSAQSLKDKRMVLKSLKDRIRGQFNVSIAELDGEDKWQTAICGLVMIGNDQRYLNSTLSHILSFIESNRDLEVSDYEISFI